MKHVPVPRIVAFSVALAFSVPLPPAATPLGAAELIKVAAQPSASPATRLDYPTKGKTVTMIVPWSPGGPAHLAALPLKAPLEKELGVNIEVVTKPGATSQTGMTQFAMSKPDGYTLGWPALPSSIAPYLDPDRKAVYGRKSFVTVANHVLDPEAIAVRGESPYRTLKDLVDAARANPGGIKVATAGVLSNNHLGQILFQRAAGIKCSFVQFDGGATVTTALLGGHVDVGAATAGNYLVSAKTGKVRLLGIMAKERSKFFPDVPTVAEQGYKIYYGSSRGIAAPEGTPRTIVELWSRAVKKAMDDPEHKRKMDELGLELYFLDADQYAQYWDEFEAQTRPLIDLAKQDLQK